MQGFTNPFLQKNSSAYKKGRSIAIDRSICSYDWSQILASDRIRPVGAARETQFDNSRAKISVWLFEFGAILEGKIQWKKIQQHKLCKFSLARNKFAAGIFAITIIIINVISFLSLNLAFTITFHNSKKPTKSQPFNDTRHKYLHIWNNCLQYDIVIVFI